MKIRTIIIDDEPRAISVLDNYLKLFCTEVEVVGKAISISTALAIIPKEKPDLVFLDMKLGDGNGLEILDCLKKIDFQVIIVTAYDDFAIKSINQHKKCICHYILKPIAIKELVRALEEVKEGFAIDDSLNPTAIKIPDKEGFVYLYKNEIIHCEAQGAWSHIFLIDKASPIVYSYTLKNLEPLLLDNKYFYRIHKSHIINRKYIKRFLKRDKGRIVMTNGRELPIARNRKQDFLNWLDNS